MGFPQKWGATFGTGDGRVELRRLRRAGGVPQPQTWQVERAQFDEMLLDHADRAASRSLEGYRVLDATFEPDGVSIEVNEATRQPQGRRASRRVIDALRPLGPARPQVQSARRRAAAREHRLLRALLRRAAPGGLRAGDIRVIARDDLGWFWVIPISDELTSVGVVLRREVFDAWPRHDARRSLDTRHRRDARRRRADAGRAPRMAGARREGFLLRLRSDTPAIDGCWPATPDRFSIRCSRPGSRSRSNPASRRGARSATR